MLHAENVSSIMCDVSCLNVPCNIRDLIYIQLFTEVLNPQEIYKYKDIYSFLSAKSLNRRNSHLPVTASSCILVLKENNICQWVNYTLRYNNRSHNIKYCKVFFFFSTSYENKGRQFHWLHICQLTNELDIFILSSCS